MFEKYLEDVRIYLDLESNLIDFFKSKLGELKKNKSSYKIQYYKTTFSNGMPFMDGNPIFSVRNEDEGKILRIVLDADASDLVTLDETCEQDKEMVVIGNILLLEKIKTKICEWLEQQSSY